MNTEHEFLIVAFEDDGTMHDAQGRMTAREACRVARSIVRYGARSGVQLTAFVSSVELAHEGFNVSVMRERCIYAVEA